MMRTYLVGLMIVGAAFALFAPTAAAAPCSSDVNPTDDNGVAVTCGGTPAGRCTVAALAYGDPTPQAGCQ